MKDSKEYSKKIQKLYRSLKRKYPKPKKPSYDEPTDALVYAIVSENMTDKAAQTAINRFSDNFVDLNDLRVSKTEEVTEALGADNPATRDIVSALAKTLAAVFAKYNTVSLEALKNMSKRPAKQILEKAEGTTCFVVDYCMLTALQGHAIPLTAKMIEYLKANDLVYPDADYQEIEGFLARQVSARNAYEFYVLLRRQSESRQPAKKKKTPQKAKTKKTTKAKKKTKKVTKKKKKAKK